jgi:predicted enzyme related to lactoylglutathione lyase
MQRKLTSVVLDTVIIQSRNIQELANFYRQGLELPPPDQNGSDHLGFQLPDFYLGFDLVGDSPDEYPGAVSLWFRVDDLGKTFQQFVDLGAQVIYPPTVKPWGDTLAAVFDPDGNVIGLAKR